MKQLELYIQKGEQRLRLGYTTGSCAAAAAGAAARLLLGGERTPLYRLRTPGGTELELEIEQAQSGPGWAACAVRKDAGDDPDVTDGLLIFVRVERGGAGIVIEGGPGVGRATLPGLPVPVGAAAINPVPLDMIRAALGLAAREHGYAGGLRATVYVPGGEAVARRTFNPRLGIEDGISILGSTGLVEPMSERALIETIRAEIAQRRALGQNTLLLVPGNYGREFAREAFGIELERAVKCSNFIGEALDCAARQGFAAVVLMGCAGKLVKVAGGIFQTHSALADARMEILAAHAALEGLRRERLEELMRCATTDHADRLLLEWGTAQAVWQRVACSLRQRLRQRLPEAVGTGCAIFTARGIAAHSQGLKALLEKGGLA